MPVVVRIPFGGGIGAVEHHSESPEAYFAHTAGLKVVACSNRRTVLDDPAGNRLRRPGVFLEPKRRYWEKAEFETAGGAPDSLWSARVVREDRM